MCENPDQVYMECGTACPPTCKNPNPYCTRQCVAGCQCPYYAYILVTLLIMHVYMLLCMYILVLDASGNKNIGSFTLPVVITKHLSHQSFQTPHGSSQKVVVYANNLLSTH